MARENNRRYFVQVCAMAQAVIHWPLDCRNRVSTQTVLYGICGEQSQGCKNVSKNLEAISNFYAPEICHGVSSTLGTYKCQALPYEILSPLRTGVQELCTRVQWQWDGTFCEYFHYRVGIIPPLLTSHSF
jgi:hypothetical protein